VKKLFARGYLDHNSAMAAKQASHTKNAARLNANSSFCRPVGAGRGVSRCSGGLPVRSIG
jgi:hypothetical protein